MARPKKTALPEGIRKRPTAKSPFFVYEINFFAGSHLGQRFERVGTDLREAKRRLAERRREVAERTYAPGERAKGKTTVAEFSERWLKAREGEVITIDNDRTRFKLHILPEIGHLCVADVDAARIVALLSALRSKRSERCNKPLSKNTIRNIYANVVTMFNDAEQQGFTLRNPCGGVRRAQRPLKAPRSETQGPSYSAEQVSRLISDERIPLDRRVLFALQFFTGTRHGEAAGLRWKHYDSSRKPLGHIRLAGQYDGLPLKGRRGQAGPARDIPVHTTLAAILAEWRLDGARALLGRRPEPEDFIVPFPDGTCRSQSRSAYYLRSDCRRVGIASKQTTHAARRTFVTLAIAGGAAESWVRRITHNASGDVLAGYQVNDWPAMCDAVKRINVTRAKPRPAVGARDRHRFQAERSRPLLRT
jgi:integrase